MGAIYALLCSVFWAFAVILLKRAGDTVPPFALNLFRVTVSLPLLIITMVVAGVPLVRAASGHDYMILAASGICGIALADTLFHTSLNMVGAGITGVVDTCYPPFTVLLAFLLIGERIGPRDVAGMALIMGAVLVAATIEPLEKKPRPHLIRGIVIGIAGVVLLSLGIVIAKPVLNHSPVLWVAAVRQAASAIVLLGAAGLSPRRGEIFRSLRPSASWRFMLPAAILGSYVALVFWIAGMKYTLAGISAILTQTSTVFIILFAVLFLREPFTRKKALAAGLALAGVLLVGLR